MQSRKLYWIILCVWFTKTHILMRKGSSVPRISNTFRLCRSSISPHSALPPLQSFIPSHFHEWGMFGFAEARPAIRSHCCLLPFSALPPLQSCIPSQTHKQGIGLDSLVQGHLSGVTAVSYLLHLRRRGNHPFHHKPMSEGYFLVHWCKASYQVLMVLSTLPLLGRIDNRKSGSSSPPFSPYSDNMFR